MLGSLRTRIFVILVAPVLLATTLAAVASFDFLQRSFSSLLQQRMTVLADDIGSLAEENDTLGQSLASFTPLQRRLEVEKSRNPDVAAIAVLNGGGAVVFDTDRPVIGSHAPEDWLPGTGLGTQVWSQSAADGLIIASPIINSFGRPIGAVVVRVSNALVGFRKAEAFRMVGLAGVGFLLLAAVAAFLAAGPLARMIRAGMADAVREIDQAGRRAAGAADDGTAMPGTGLLARLLPLLHPLEEAERTLRQIDEGA